MTAEETLSIADLQTLRQSYMPALERGGIFVPTRERYALGQALSVLLTLPGEREPVRVSGQVAWVSPEGAGERRPPGVGLHFGDADQAVRVRIEVLLAGRLDEDAPTYTL